MPRSPRSIRFGIADTKRAKPSPRTSPEEVRRRVQESRHLPPSSKGVLIRALALQELVNARIEYILTHNTAATRPTEKRSLEQLDDLWRAATGVSRKSAHRAVILDLLISAAMKTAPTNAPPEAHALEQIKLLYPEYASRIKVADLRDAIAAWSHRPKGGAKNHVWKVLGEVVDTILGSEVAVLSNKNIWRAYRLQSRKRGRQLGPLTSEE